MSLTTYYVFNKGVFSELDLLACVTYIIQVKSTTKAVNGNLAIPAEL